MMGVSAVLLIVAAGIGPQVPSDHVSTPGALEGRPPAAEASPLQARIDRARDGEIIEVGPGTYMGDLVIERRLRIVGRGRPLLVGSGTGSVVRVRADEVTIEGLDIDGRGGGDLGHDSSGIHVSGQRAVIRECRIRNALFGIYLREAHGLVVERCSVAGIRGKDPGERRRHRGIRRGLARLPQVHQGSGRRCPSALRFSRHLDRGARVAGHPLAEADGHLNSGGQWPVAGDQFSGRQPLPASCSLPPN
jgi:hypothetical protein